MMNKCSVWLLAALLGAGTPAWAVGFGHQQDVVYAQENMPVFETSARILSNAQGTAPELVADIYDGLGKEKVPGYKIQIMARNASLAADARPLKDGKGWMHNRYIHRGAKIVVGIPVKNHQLELNQAVLLNVALIVDKPDNPKFKAEDKIRPRGMQLVRQDAKVHDGRVEVRDLQLPDMVSGETSGGGVKLTASALINGKPLHITINSTFQEFGLAKPDAARGFEADKRLFEK